MTRLAFRLTLPRWPGLRRAARFRAHLVELVLATSLPIVVLAGGLTLWHAETERAMTLRGMSDMAGALQRAIDRELEATIALLELLASSPEVAGAVGAGPGAPAAAQAGFHGRASELVARRPGALLNLVLIAPDGRQILNTARPPGAALPDAEQVRSPSGDGGPEEPPRLYAEVLQRSRPLVSPLVVGPVTGRPFVTAMIPVRRGGQVIALLAGNLDPSGIGALLRDPPPPAGWLASVIDRNGLVVARSREGTRFLGERAHPAVATFAAGTASEGLIEARSLEGEATYAALRRLTLAPWVIGYGAPRNLVDAPARRALAVMGALGVLALLLAAGAAALVGGRLGRELESLAAAAGELVEGRPGPETGAARRVAEVEAVRDALAAAGRAVAARDAALREDIAQREQAEAALRDLNETLERRVGEAVAAREHALAQLAQAQKMEAVGQLTGGIAHDFNNLLTAIAGNLELIQMAVAGGATGRVGDLAAAALRAAERGARLNASMLAFSRKQWLRPEIVDANALLREFEPLVRRAVGETVTVELALDPALRRCRVDAAQLEAAILNLAINARDAMEPAGGRLTVSTGNADLGAGDLADNADAAPGRFVAVTVADTGRGMTPAVLARVFDPFFTTKEVGRGSGLGLSQVYGYIRQLGGHVAIDSAPGRGTRVTLHLPVAEPLADAPATVADGPALVPAALGARLLVAEDDAQVREVTCATLQALGCEVLAAADGRAALALLERDVAGIDLLLSDVVMPNGMSGVELARAARRLRPGLKVLLTSGYPAAVLQAQATADEFAVMAKPYRTAELAARIHALLGTARAA